MTVVELKGVSRKYGNIVALDCLDLVVEKGEFLTLLGPSGSGKTTLLNIIAGMTPPSSGRVEIDGRDVTDMPTRQRGLGMVFQNYALMPHMTVFDNIAFPLRVRRVREQEIRIRVAEVLDIVNLRDLGGRKPRELSGGQQQRVAIARCLVYKPSLILMDEPLGALDKKLREQLQLEIKRLHSDLGVTVVYVTHDQEEALTLSDRICLMNTGRIEQLGTPHELYFAPETVFGAQFLGESNVLTATVSESSSEETVLRCSVGTIRAPTTSVATGAEVTIVVRPENIRRLAPGECIGNELSGELIDTTFVGGVTRYYVRPDNGSVLVLKELTNRTAWAAGSGKVRIGWSAEHTLVIQNIAGR
ncbi:ABC transporter ATP-binding protein [Reyranella soli]|jgi:putative spermidine/putrescine transport system ATP-binding protein|uniref:Spermidine/putrescine import ATP-binding protein PotA n=1 Tax=Reyranella soli TaxID=1230389 RepID=A0A512N963_9HYPH|nr:ABC transporter ATP-binding protein [Reyranella soli]GEP55517.1 polyamine-transporting ATPase [Reyranella soli]